MVERIEAKEKLAIGIVIVSFIGEEGCGKTDQAKLLAKACGKPYISTSALLREIEKNDPGPLGDKVREMFLNNVYLDGESMIEVLVRRFSQPDTANGFILDGGFRTLIETVNFREALWRSGRDFPVHVRYLQTPRKESDRRLDGRKRDDDTLEKRARRRAEFYKDLPERLAHIKKEEGWSLIEISGVGTKEEVLQRVKDSLKIAG